MSDKAFITSEQAEAMIPDAEYIHTFRQGGPCLIGADLERSKLLESFRKYKVELSGEQATKMNHGIVFMDEHGPCFVETRMPKKPGTRQPNR
jgi:hypothetical protein